MFVEEPIAANPTFSSARQQHLFSLLQNCCKPKKLSQVHSQIIVNGFAQKYFILVKLLALYITSGNLLNARKVFENIDRPSTAIWNQMIRTYARSQMSRESVELYKQMVAKEGEPDRFTYSSLLSVCARSGWLREGEQVHGRVLISGYISSLFIRTNLVNLYAMAGSDIGVRYARRVFDDMVERNVVSWNSLLACYIRCGDIDGARRIFNEMPERNVVSWTTMIAGCAHNGKCKQALYLFDEMQRSGVGLDQLALVAALSACAELGNLELGMWIHSYIRETFSLSNQPLLSSLNNALIHMYASCGEIEEAYEAFRKMQKRTTVSWTSMITGFVKLGYALEALGMFEWMQSLGGSGVRPDGITLTGVLCACSHAGLIDEGLHLFMCMNEKWGIKHEMEHYECIVDLVSRAGFLDEACTLIERMPMKPNDAVWGALLRGCRIHKNSELASHVAQKLAVEFEPDGPVCNLVLLANAYAIGKHRQDVANLRQKMFEVSLRKPPERSWVQVNGVFQDFVAGDRSHKHATFIYQMLRRITMHAKSEGCGPNISELFPDMEDFNI